MKWICPICGMKIESNDKPLACPLCGANGSYIIPESDFSGFPKDLKTESKESLRAALELETNATRDYFRYAMECEKVGDIETAKLFTALAKVENGHQIAIRKMLSE